MEPHLQHASARVDAPKQAELAQELASWKLPHSERSVLTTAEG